MSIPLRERNVYIVDEKCQLWQVKQDGVVDSGANINVIPLHVAENMQLTIYQEQKPYSIIFGQGATVLVKEYVMGNGLVNKVAVAEGMNATLFNITQFTDQDMLVIFDKTTVRVEYDNKLIISGKLLTGSGLYVFDLRELLSAPAVQKSNKRVYQQMSEGVSITHQSNAICMIASKTRYKLEDIQTVRRMHLSMDHMSFGAMASNIRNGIWKNVPPEITAALVDAVGAKDDQCIGCAVAKWNRKAGAVGTGVSGILIGNDLSFDWIACKPISYYGSIGMFLFECLASGYVIVLGGTDKSDSLMQAIQLVRMFFRQHGWTVKTARCDAGSVEMSKKFGEHCATLGIVPRPTAPEEQRANGVERLSQTIKKGIHAALISQSNLSNRHWLSAAQYAAVMRNVSTNTRSRMIDPEKSVVELVTRVKPDLSHIAKMPYGQLVVVPSPTYETGHQPYLTPKNELAVFLVPKLDGSGAAYVLREGASHPVIRKQLIVIKSKIIQLTPEKAESLLPQTDTQGTITFQTAIPVDFSLSSSIQNEYENIFPTSSTVSDIQHDDNAFQPEIGWGGKLSGSLTKITPAITRSMARKKDSIEDNINVTDLNNLTNHNNDIGTVISEQGDIDDIVKEDTDDAVQCLHDSEDTKVFSAIVLKVLKKRDETNPSWGQIVKSIELQKIWGPTYRKELDGFVSKSLERVSKEEALAGDILPIHMDQTTKRSGEKKSRGVWRGDIEIRRGLHSDRDKLFSPNLKSSTLMMVISLSVHQGFEISSSDVTQAFANNPFLREKPLYTSFDKVMSTSGEIEYYKATATGYGLPEASRVWYNEYSGLLIRVGCSRSNFDPCLFFWRRGNGLLIIGLTTDDALRVNSPNEEGRKMLKEVHQAMKDKGWKMTEADQVTELLGINFLYNPNGSVTLTQKGQLKRIKDHFYPDTDYADIPKTYIPMPKEWTPQDSKASTPISVNIFLGHVGTIMYILKTRLEVSTSISILSGKGKNPTEMDNLAAFHLARYLITTATVGLTFYPGTNGVKEIISYIGNADAAFDIDLDSKSRYGWMVKQANTKGGAFLAKSKKESGPPSDSTCTAEIGSLCEVVKDVIVVRGIAEELGYLQQLPTIIGEDNQSVCHLTKDLNGKTGKRCRHIQRHIAFVAGYIQQKIIQLKQVTSREQEANILTKILTSAIEHWRETERLLGESAEITVLQQIVSGKKSVKSVQGLVFSSLMTHTNEDFNREKIIEDFISLMSTNHIADDEYIRGVMTLLNTYNNESNQQEDWHKMIVQEGIEATENKRCSNKFISDIIPKVLITNDNSLNKRINRKQKGASEIRNIRKGQKLTWGMY